MRTYVLYYFLYYFLIKSVYNLFYLINSTIINGRQSNNPTNEKTCDDCGLIADHGDVDINEFLKVAKFFVFKICN